MTLDDFDHELLLVEEARQVLRLGRRQIYEAVARGQIPALNWGGLSGSPRPPSAV